MSPPPEPVQGDKPICTNPEHCCRALTRVWQALGIENYTGKSVDEHVTELRTALKDAQQRFVTLEAERDMFMRAWEARMEEREAWRTWARFVFTELPGDADNQTVFRDVCHRWDAVVARTEAADRDLAALREELAARKNYAMGAESLKQALRDAFRAGNAMERIGDRWSFDVADVGWEDAFVAFLASKSLENIG